jgi:hypothetical protein
MAAVTPVRLALGAVGIAGLLWGAWHLLDDGLTALVSVAIWLAGAVVVHDAVVAPVTVGVTVLGARFLPRPARMPVTVAFVVWATCSIAFVAVLTGHADSPYNQTIGHRPYVLAWIVLTVVLAAAATAASVVRARRLDAR